MFIYAVKIIPKVYDDSNTVEQAALCHVVKQINKEKENKEETQSLLKSLGLELTQISTQISLEIANP